MFSDSCHKYRIFEYLTQKNHFLNLVNVYTYFKKKTYSPIKIVLSYCFKFFINFV